MIVKSDPDQIQGFLKDASNMPGGVAERVAFPETEDEIVELLRDCNRLGTPVTVAGAGTGLAGGRVPFGGTVISMARMNRIVNIDPKEMRALVEPGAMLGKFQQEVERQGLFYPPDPTERNCFIGATVVTNSSGARTFKYGPTRNFITGLRIVLATGERIDLRRGQLRAEGRELRLRTLEGNELSLRLPSYDMPAIKHAAGYFSQPDMDAIDLFIGSEGTLGVVTQVEVRLLPLPERLFSGVVFFPDEASTLAFVDAARSQSYATRAGHVGDGLDARALEFIDANALDFIRGKFPTIPSGARGGAIWFEQEVDAATEQGLLEGWYQLIVEHGGMADESWFGIGQEDQKRMREFRHAVPAAVYERISEHGHTKLGTDMAVPDGAMRELLGYYRELFQQYGVDNIIYGHIGNNHLHANMFADGEAEFATAKKLYGLMVTRALALGGTISAEHGVGKLKRRYLVEMYGEEGIEEMRRVKSVLDPKGILGKGTMFEPEGQGT